MCFISVINYFRFNLSIFPNFQNLYINFYQSLASRNFSDIPGSFKNSLITSDDQKIIYSQSFQRISSGNETISIQTWKFETVLLSAIYNSDCQTSGDRALSYTEIIVNFHQSSLVLLPKYDKNDKTVSISKNLRLNSNLTPESSINVCLASFFLIKTMSKNYVDPY